MRKLIVFVTVLAFVVSCKNNSENKKLEERIERLEQELSEKESNKEKETSKETTKSIEIEDISEKGKENAYKEGGLTSTLESYIIGFKDCKVASTKRADCRNAFTELISNVYKLNEFKNKNGDYKIYDSIQPIIARTKSWENIGAVTKQKNIDKALEHVNNGGLALVIDTSKSYGHVVMIQSGETKKSGSWELKLPNVLSLANHNPEKSFQGKSLAYAFKKSDDLQIFIRK